MLQKLMKINDNSKHNIINDDAYKCQMNDQYIYIKQYEIF